MGLCRFLEDYFKIQIKPVCSLSCALMTLFNVWNEFIVDSFFVLAALLQLEGGGTLLASVQALGCSCAIEKQPLPRSVSWMRRTVCAQVITHTHAHWFLIALLYSRWSVDIYLSNVRPQHNVILCCNFFKQIWYCQWTKICFMCTNIPS